MIELPLQQIEALFQDVCTAAASTLAKVSTEGNAYRHIGTGADGAPTTRLDSEIEMICLDILTKSDLVGWVLSEESGRVHIDGRARFGAILDPLDGTSNAEVGFPYYALSLALMLDETAVAAVVLNYSSRDCFQATLGRGATRNGRPIRVAADQGNLQSARIVSSRPLKKEESEAYARLMLSVRRLRIAGSPALDTAHVASGTFGGYVDYHVPHGLIHTHDIIAGALILQEAGGIILDETGKPLALPLNASATFNVFAVGTAALYPQLASCFGL